MSERNINLLFLARLLTEAEPTTQACAPTRNPTGNLSLCRMMPNPLSHAGQGVDWYLRKMHILSAILVILTVTYALCSNKGCFSATHLSSPTYLPARSMQRLSPGQRQKIHVVNGKGCYRWSCSSCHQIIHFVSHRPTHKACFLVL